MIFVVKYRKKVIDDAICDRLKEIFIRIASDKRYQLEIVEFNHDADHLASSRLIKKEFPEIRKKLWKEACWSQSFFLATTGGVTLDVLQNYVRTQGEKSV